MEDQEAARDQLKALGLVAFVGAREGPPLSGVTERLGTGGCLSDGGA